MIKLDPFILKTTTPDAYCGYNYLCAEGGTLLGSFSLWIVLLISLFFIGFKLGDGK